MKKLFITVLALVSLVACNKSQVLDELTPSAIEFGGAFVDKATKADPSTTTNNIEKITVWGFMDGVGGDLYPATGIEVSKNNGEWTYEEQYTQYWTPGHMYYFAAMSPAPAQNVLDVTVSDTNDELTKGLGQIEFTNADGTVDLLYDAVAVSTANMTVGQDMDKVNFTMKHLLSKVKFTFTNGFKNQYNTITIENIKMTVPKTATLDLAVANWWDNTDDWTVSGNETSILEFGHMNGAAKLAVGASASSDDVRFTVPASANQSYVVTFDVTLYSNEVIALTRKLTTTISGCALQMGKAYNFTANIDHTNIAENELKPIEFAVDVEEWITNDKPETDYDQGTPDTQVVNN